MLSNNPQFDKFKTILTDDFFIPAICDKYNALLAVQNHPIRSIQQMILESIQSVDSPGFGYETVEQGVLDSNNNSTTTNSQPKISEQSLAEQKRLTISFRHTEGFLTYFCMLEHYFGRFKMGPGNTTARMPFSAIAHTTYSHLMAPFCRMIFRQCHFMSIPALSFSYSNVQRTFSEFSCTFSYNILEPAITLPEPQLRNNCD